jgi:hypothetical protein
MVAGKGPKMGKYPTSQEANIRVNNKQFDGGQRYVSESVRHLRDVRVSNNVSSNRMAGVIV